MEDKPVWLTFLIRILCAAPFFYIFFTVRASLLSPIFMIIVAVILAKPMAELVVDTLSQFFTSSARYDRPPPVYSIPQARRAEGKFEEAMAGFEALVEKYPQEVHAYVEMIEMAQIDLLDQDRARHIYERALAALKDASQKEALTRIYEAMQIRRPSLQEVPPRRIQPKSASANPS